MMSHPAPNTTATTVPPSPPPPAAVVSPLAAALTSWGAVHALLMLPAALMLANFAAGRCVLAEALEGRQHVQRYNAGARRWGRAVLVAVVAALAWQYAAVFVQARRDALAASTPSIAATATSSEVVSPLSSPPLLLSVVDPAERWAAERAALSRCGPLHAAWGALDSLRQGQLRALLSGGLAHAWDCRAGEWVHLLLLLAFAASYVVCVLSVPQAPAPEAAEEPPEGSGKSPSSAALTSTKTSHARPSPLRVSRCSKCGAAVPGMDHHCYLINNCVSRRTRGRFLACLACGVANYAHLLWTHGGWALGLGPPELPQGRTARRPAPLRPSALAGLVLVVSFLLYLTALLVLHCALWARDTTTLAVLRAGRRRGCGFPRAAFDVLVLGRRDGTEAEVEEGVGVTNGKGKREETADKTK